MYFTQQISFVILLLGALSGFHVAEIKAQNLKLVLTSSKLPRPNYAQIAVFDGDDSIYLVGGGGYDTLQDDLIKYTISDGATQIVGRFIEMRAGTAIIVGGHIFHFGGTNSSGSSSDIYRITLPRPDGSTNFSFEVVSQLPVPGTDFQAAWDAVNHVAYLCGGRDGDEVLWTVLEYNTTSNQIRSKGFLPEGVSDMAAVWNPHKETAYLFGGYSHELGGYQQDILEYDPAGHTFQHRGTLPRHYNPGPYAVYAHMGQEVYMFNRADAEVVKFTPFTDSALQVEFDDSPDRFIPGASVYVPQLDRIYVFGGRGRYGGGPTVSLDDIWYIDLVNSPIPSTEEPPTTTEPQEPEPVDCSDGITRMVPNPYCCENFYLCQNGVPNKYECTNGQQFHPVQLQCQDASLVGCRNRYNNKIEAELAAAKQF